jgi:hypothetical protein
VAVDICRCLSVSPSLSLPTEHTASRSVFDRYSVQMSPSLCLRLSISLPPWPPVRLSFGVSLTVSLSLCLFLQEQVASMSQQICDLQDLLSVSVHVPPHVAKCMS